MNHKTIQLLVSSHLDGEVNDSEKAMVLSHLEVCSECRQFIEQAKFLHEEICSLGEVELAHSFTARVAYSVERRDEQTVEWLGIEPSARNTFFVLAIVVFLMFIFTTFDKKSSVIASDQLLSGYSADSVSTRLLLQQDGFSKSDLLYAVMIK